MCHPRAMVRRPRGMAISVLRLMRRVDDLERSSLSLLQPLIVLGSIVRGVWSVLCRALVARAEPSGVLSAEYGAIRGGGWTCPRTL